MSILKLRIVRSHERYAPALPLWIVFAFAVLCLLTWVLWSSTGEVTAQVTPSRIGVADFQRILKESAPGKGSVGKIAALQEKRFATAKQMSEEMRRLDNDLKNPALTAAQRRTIEQTLAEKQLAIKRFAEDAEKEIATTRDRELESLQVRLKPVIDAVGREMGMAAIFNKYESGLIYTSDAIDITGTLIVRFNAASSTQPVRPGN